MLFNYYYYYCLLVQCLIIFSQCKLGITKAIVGVNIKQAEYDQFPFVVSVKYKSNIETEPEIDHVCTGILVSRQDVLTAEHCFVYLEVNTTEIIVGSVDLAAGTKYYPEWWITYSEWADRKNKRKQFKDNDIAVIRLRRQVPETIKIPALSKLTNYNLHGLSVRIAGWGRANNGKTPRILTTTSLKVLRTPECEHRIERLFGRRIPLPISVLCTVGEPYALLDLGDSGGPVLYKGTLVGINILRCPLLVQQIQPGQVNLHLSIFHYRNFIMDVKHNF